MPEIGKWETTTQLTVLTGDITTANDQNLELVPDGTGIVQIGDAGTTNWWLNTNDDLFVSGRLEVDGDVFFDGYVNLTVGAKLFDAGPCYIGTHSEAIFGWNTYQANHALTLGIDVGTATGSGNIIICEKADLQTDFGHPIAANPTLYVQSVDATVPAKHLRFYHDGVDGRIHCGSGKFILTSDADRICLSAPTGIVYAHNSAAHSKLRAHDSTGADYIEITHSGTAGYLLTNADVLLIRGAFGVDVQETRGWGMRIPTAVSASPTAGSMYFDAATNRLYCHNGTVWVGVTLT